ncbi:hypothetical protein FSW04_21380 [Baekduia soli]|uniref:Uncharacterized protein n=1 Tax=Baekduia soli TaxID=496014 RepID=A0A5B8UA20_9ACTN|nr:hypothetical protein [Baekduia soli]QEC49867.1 hypothetical protein FSW04_21380 [Baekduia soli]
MLLVLAALILVATAVSVVRSTGFRQRVPSDQSAFHAWAAAAHVRLGEPVPAPGARQDVVCGAAPGYRQCLLVNRAGRVIGGYRAPDFGARDRHRSACFGEARAEPACRDQAGS